MSQTALQKMLMEVAVLIEQEEFHGKRPFVSPSRPSPIGPPSPLDETANDGAVVDVD